ncbi:TIGR02594 family protein [Neorhizobium sp. P12A]|uniref:TIGR02594 family protein n=1 Tax=Neorhizobium sp. P12A TaxID=2268027 RepID=UPI0011EE4727|nr:TIGR02594 family protein [Neorhizobium sp. P12A]KAA0697407.1 TIGR02594 family protein [Neorhizobium sp. P12A]
MVDHIAEPRWLTFARKYSGLKEVAGSGNNPEIVAMWKKLGLPFRDDATPWCAGFVGFVLESSGIKSTRSGLALSYEKWGQALKAPAVGCVVTFKRTGGGHVGFVVGKDASGNLLVLGGNQADAVNIKGFPPARATSYRWPAGEPLPSTSLPIGSAAISTSEA